MLSASGQARDVGGHVPDGHAAAKPPGGRLTPEAVVLRAEGDHLEHGRGCS